jgi:hypothetical protein
MLRPALPLAILIVALIAGCNSNDVPAGTMAALQQADHYELLSLDPSRVTEPPPGHFHGWRILGRTTISDSATRMKLNEALRAGARENSDTAAACFNPRHGIRAVRDGKAYDVVICFECLQAQVFEAGQQGESFLVSESPQPAFDDVLRAAGVPLADKPQ